MFAEATKQHRSAFLCCLGLAVVLFVGVPLLASQHFDLPARVCFSYAWKCFLTVVLLILAGVLVRYVRLKRQPDAVILDLGRDKRAASATGSQWIGPILLGLFAVSAFLEKDYGTALLCAGLAVSFSILSKIAGSASVQMTEQGIRTGVDFVRWQQIEAYDWTPDGAYLVYKIRRWLPMFHVGSIPVPKDSKDALSEMFDRHVSRQKE